MFSAGEMLNYKLGGKNNQIKSNILIKGDFVIPYCKENHLYFICRRDGKKITGNEDTRNWKYEDGKLVPIKYDNFEYMLVRLVMGYTGSQEDEIPFLEFSYEMQEDDSVVVIYPHYLDKEPNVQIKLNTDLDEELADVSFMVRTEKICLGPINKLDKEDVKRRKLIPPEMAKE